MASTDSTATSGRVFTPESWRPNEGKSKEENVASFRSYATEMEKKMKRHLEFLEQELSKAESKKEKGETSKKRKREVERDGCGEWPVIVIESDNDDAEANCKEGAGAEEEGEERDECDETDEDEENEEDGETDENPESDVNSDSETNSVKEAIVNSDEASESRSYSYNDDDSGSDSDSGNQQEGNQETSEDSSMFRMRISD